jgi:hypothetical protein
VQSGLNKFSDILSSKGGTQINGLIESLKQTPEGQNLVAVLKKLNPDTLGALDALNNLGTDKKA